jgi:hypothetical protein
VFSLPCEGRQSTGVRGAQGLLHREPAQLRVNPLVEHLGPEPARANSVTGDSRSLRTQRVLSNFGGRLNKRKESELEILAIRQGSAIRMGSIPLVATHPCLAIPRPTATNVVEAGGHFLHVPRE